MAHQELVLFQPEEVAYALLDSSIGYCGISGGYRISNQGVLETRLIRTGFHEHGLGSEWSPKRLSPDKDGYLFSQIYQDGKTKIFYIHRLVAHYFIGPCPVPGYEVCHNSPGRTNNCASNLRWDTHKNNLADRVKDGTDSRGDKSPNSKLSWPIVRAMRDNHQGVFRTPVRILARQHNVSEGAIRKVLNYESWVEVS